MSQQTTALHHSSTDSASTLCQSPSGSERHAGRCGTGLSQRTSGITTFLLIAASSLWLNGFFPGQELKAVAGEEERTQPSREDGSLQPSEVSVTKSRVYIFVDKSGFGHQHAVEGRLSSGTLRLGAVEDAGELIFDMKSFDADTDAARRYLGLQGTTELSTRRQVNENMKNTSILNVAQYPSAKFAVKSAVRQSRKSPKGLALYELTGEFTLRGKTRPLKFQAEVETTDGMTHVRGRFSILQTQYGITPFRKALGTIGVADQLTIHGDLWVAETAVESP